MRGERLGSFTAASRRGELSSVLGRFLRFACIGGLATVVQYVVLIALVRAGADPVVASAAGFAASVGLNYWLNYRFTFRSRRRHRETAIRFAALATVGLLLNSLVMTALTHGAGVHYLAAQLAATATVLLWNFLGNEWWTFRRPA
jgi:putative flippase GtrA